MQLSKEQKHIIKEVLRLLKEGNQQIIKIAGYAGTGKTVIVANLFHILQDFGFCAFTGKAASVLRKKKIPGQTIHSIIYEPKFDEDGEIQFILTEVVPCRGFVVDEASMVGQDIYQDLLSFGLPVIFVGDHGQLEPIGSDINLMAKPDYCLEEIHRNAGEIAFFAEWIRKGNPPRLFKAKDKVQFINRWDMNRYMTQVDQMICAFNKTRVGLNDRARTELINTGNLIPGKNFDFHRPLIGDKIMCLRNSKEHGLFNGMQGVVTSLSDEGNDMVFTSEEQDFSIKYDPSQFSKEKYEISYDKDDPHPFDFAYAISCHKAQGSEWEKVMVIEQYCAKWNQIRWMYSAATRAKEKLIWAC